MSIITPVGNAVLLHVCCGVCLGWPVQKLRDEGYCVIGYFFNPNIYPKEEYLKRLEAAKQMAQSLEMELIEGEYDHEKWLQAVAGLESEKEGGKRCDVCFRVRLDAAHKKAQEIATHKFASTLSVSPHKDHGAVSRTGKGINDRKFLDIDFKKEDGFKKTRALARQHSLYCQNYCGCEFSVR
jgi:epoxyqueuosine reductase